MLHDELGSNGVTMVTPSIARDVGRCPRAVVNPTDPPWKQAGARLRNLAIDEAGPGATPTQFAAAHERVCRAHPELKATWDAMGLRGTRQDKEPVAVEPAAGGQIARREVERKPAMTTPLRRAQLINGHAVTMTDRGVIIDNLEIEYTPTFAEASREVGRRQRAYMLAGVEAHEALARALEEAHPVFRTAYLGVR